MVKRFLSRRGFCQEEVSVKKRLPFRIMNTVDIFINKHFKKTIFTERSDSNIILVDLEHYKLLVWCMTYSKLVTVHL